mgnify:CR=1 FL=1
MIRILIVEDEALLSELLVRSLETQPDMAVIGRTGKACEAAPLCEALRPDLVLMDIRTAEGNGIRATADIKRRFPGIKVVMLTALPSGDLALQAAAAGADSYLSKAASTAALFEAIRHTAMGDSIRLTGEGSPREKPVFTALELEILRLLSEGNTAREIADRLHFSHGTIRNHISDMITRTGLRDRVQLVVYAISEGLLG